MARFTDGPPAKPPLESAPVTVRHGHFWVGADPDRDGVAPGPMYVYWEAPAEVTKPYPIVLIHGGAGQGLDYLATPDGRGLWVYRIAGASRSSLGSTEQPACR